MAALYTPWGPQAWLRRYLPAELLSSACGLLALCLAHTLIDNAFVVALVGTWSGSVSFYSILLVGELRTRGITHFGAALRGLVLEFGPAEALDSFLVRPALIYIGVTLLTDPMLGMIVGEFAADLCFYALAIQSYSLVHRSVVQTA